MKGHKVLFSSQSDSWKTPEGLYHELDKEFNFNFDPCPFDKDPKLTNTLFDEQEEFKRSYNRLTEEWAVSNFVNPPYSDISTWMEKAYIEFKKNKTVVLLVPSRTDTRWFHKYCLPFATEIRFIKGRLKFSGSKNNAPFPSMIVIFKR